MSSIVANAERTLFGRRVIYTDVTEITLENIASVVTDAILVHLQNSDEIQYLYDYYKGKQPILNRIKEVRQDINNKIVVNYANEIVSFKVGYLAGEPIQYVSHCERVNSDEVNTLNDFMFSENKAKKDQEIIEWGYICGTAYRYVRADAPSEMDDSPFEIYTLDPRYTFIVYSSDIGHRPMLAVTYTIDNDTVKHFTAYTRDSVYSFTENGIPVKVAENGYNPIIPIFEYPANNARLGSFEIVLPLLDAINRTESNRLDGIEQQIQAFLKFVNCDIDEDGLKAMHEYGAIKIKSDSANPADVELVSINFSQSDAQVSKEDLYNAVLTIVGMPTMGNGSDTISANNGAVLVNNGWSQAEARAKDSETMFKGAENEMLKLILRICKTLTDSVNNLKSTDIDLKFTRRNYENIQSKAQVLCEMLNNPHIHPKLAFEHSGMFSDPETAYTMSEEYYQENLEKWNVEIVPGEDGSDVRDSGSVDSIT